MSIVVGAGAIAARKRERTVPYECPRCHRYRTSERTNGLCGGCADGLARRLAHVFGQCAEECW